MPTYGYRCYACGNNFEVFQKISDDPVKVCPYCQSAQVKRLLFATAFHLKGSGWYKTDYGSNGNGSSGSSPAEKKEDTASPSGSDSAAGSGAQPAEKSSSTETSAAPAKSESAEE